MGIAKRVVRGVPTRKGVCAAKLELVAAPGGPGPPVMGSAKRVVRGVPTRKGVCAAKLELVAAPGGPGPPVMGSAKRVVRGSLAWRSAAKTAPDVEGDVQAASARSGFGGFEFLVELEEGADILFTEPPADGHVVDGEEGSRKRGGCAGFAEDVIDVADVLVRELLLKMDLEIALDHTGHKGLEKGTVAAADGNRVKHGLQIESEFLSECDAFANAREDRLTEIIIDQFDGVSGARSSDVEKICRDRLKERQQSVKCLLVAAANDIKLPFFGLHFAAGKRGVEERDTPFGQFRREGLGGGWIAGGKIHHGMSCMEMAADTVLVPKQCLDDVGIRDAKHDHVTGLGEGLEVFHFHGALFRSLGGVGPCTFVAARRKTDGHARLAHVFDHAGTHDPDADETGFRIHALITFASPQSVQSGC